jgi:anti-anti-sigma factor
VNITAECYGQSVILNCKGELTVDSLEAFRQAVEHQLEESHVRDVVLNFEAVVFVDSAGMEYLLDLQEMLNDRLGQVKLVGLDENVSKILEITRLDSAFERFSNVSDAVRTM